MKKPFILITIVFISTNMFAQLPNTDIWLLDIKTINDSIILKNPVNITNRVGYDNQPAFSPDGKYFLYTSIREDKQADIYKYDLDTKIISQFTHTATSEYSPTFMPDGKNISVVMVEPDSTQRLWKFPIVGGSPTLLMKNIDSIGYHCWINKDSLALVMITEPPILEVVNVNTEKFKHIANDLGRCMVQKDGVLYFIQRLPGDSINYLTLYSVNNKNKIDSIEILSEDFALMKIKGMIAITGLESKIYSTTLEKEITKQLIDLSRYGIKKITRIAINKERTKLVIVAESN